MSAGRDLRLFKLLASKLGAKYPSTERATTRGRVTSIISILFSRTMNTFVDRFSTTSAVSQLRRAQRFAEEEDDLSDVAWGSQAGFGNIMKGAPSFNVPDIPDVRSLSKGNAGMRY